MDISTLFVFLAIVAAAVLLRRKINDPASPFGQWFERNVRSRFGQGLKLVLFLTVIIWFAVYLSAPEKDRSSLSDLFARFLHPEGKSETGKEKAPEKRAQQSPAASPETGRKMAPPVR